MLRPAIHLVLLFAVCVCVFAQFTVEAQCNGAGLFDWHSNILVKPVSPLAKEQFTYHGGCLFDLS